MIVDQSVPSEIVEIIIGYCVNNAARKIQWYFREQHKLEIKLFSLINRPTSGFQYISSLFFLIKRLHINEHYIKFNICYCMTFHLDNFWNTELVNQTEMEKLEHNYLSTFGVPYARPT